MPEFRNLTPAEIASAQANGSSAQDWSHVTVAEGFTTAQLRQSRLEGRVEIGPRACIFGSCVRNYRIGADSIVEQVTALECRHESHFGNNTPVATINECAGRTVHICDTLSAQAAYIMAIYRHRTQTIKALERMVSAMADNQQSTMGRVGTNCRITGAKFIREVHIGNNVTIDGASLLEDGTLCDGASVGIDTKASHFIAAQGSRITGGATIERCFVGESCTIANGFTAIDSLFFANSHCENGEAASIFAGPYTVSHHKSTLLIAAMFSFFNAGSGTNLSNHLFKSGAVHQSIHPRGCKFGSGAYVMAPAIEGAFTVVLGRHSAHHDTSEFPYSYLLEKDGRSTLMPGANLTSYGTVRDTQKWPARDMRLTRRDVINFEEFNPYICSIFINALNALNTLSEADPQAESYNHKKVTIKPTMLRRGVGLYNKAIVASLGDMLSKGHSMADHNGSGPWVDLAGQYITKRALDVILDQVDRGEINSLTQLDNQLQSFATQYNNYAHSYAEGLLATLLGHTPSKEEIAEAIVAGSNALAAMRRTTDSDRERDCSVEMAVGYGIDSHTNEEIMADYYAVRGLK